MYFTCLFPFYTSIYFLATFIWQQYFADSDYQLTNYDVLLWIKLAEIRHILTYLSGTVHIYQYLSFHLSVNVPELANELIFICSP